jgi:ankyrin repeat protein
MNLLDLVTAGDLGGVRARLQFLTETDQLEEINQSNGNGWSPLTIAARSGKLAILQDLLQAPGILVNQAHPETGITALHAAILAHSFITAEVQHAIINALLSAPNIDLNQEDKAGKSALFYAIKNVHCDVIIQRLILNGASIHVLDKKPLIDIVSPASKQRIEAWALAYQAKQFQKMLAEFEQLNAGQADLPVEDPNQALCVQFEKLSAGADAKRVHAKQHFAGGEKDPEVQALRTARRHNPYAVSSKKALERRQERRATRGQSPYPQ